jgi:protein SCO1
MWIAALALLVMMFGSPAAAALTRSELDAIVVAPKPDAALPLPLSFLDESGRAVTLRDAIGGRPAVLIFADYTCRTLCGPILSFAAAALEQAGLSPDRDYRLVVIGLDPKDSLDAARSMKAARLGADSPVARAAVFLTGDEAEIRSAAAALGYRYADDSEHDRIAHPAAVFILNSTGRLTRMLSGFALSGSDVRLALVEAGEGRVGSLGDRVRLLCYGFDPVHGIYTETITTWLEAGALATLLALGGGIRLMNAKLKRRAPS